MKRIITAFSVLLGCFIISSGQVNHLVTFMDDFSLSTVLLEDGNPYTKISIPGTQSTDKISYPRLPVKYLNLIIPAGNHATGLTVKSEETRRMVLENPVEPSQPPVPTSIDFVTQDFVKPDREFYSSDSVFPGKTAEIIDQGSFRGNSIVTLAIYPFQYSPNVNTLEFSKSISITVDCTPVHKTGIIPDKNPGNIIDFNRILKSLVENKSDVELYSTFLSGDQNKKSSDVINVLSDSLQNTRESISISCDYVVITDSSLAPGFNEFLAWKKRKGIDIKLVTIQDILSDYSGDTISEINDNAGKLRQFLAEAYSNGLVYALLAGDHTVMPIRYGWNLVNYDNSYFIIPTDLYFSDFDGDWKVDNDTRYGEPYGYSGDDVDFHPEIYIGRLLCSNHTEVSNWIKKLLIYEQNPGKGDRAYLKKAFYTQADQLQESDQARYIADKLYSIFNDTTVFEEIYEGVPDYASSDIPDFPNGYDVISEMNNNYGLVCWFNHGGPQGIGVGVKGNNPNPCEYRSKYNTTSFDIWDDDGTNVTCGIPEYDNGFDDLINFDYPSIAYTISCVVTPFDDFNHNPSFKNMGEGFTVLTETGGPHFLGNTRNGWVSDSYLLFEEFINSIIDDSIFNLGIAEANSKQNFGSNTHNLQRYLKYSHNLIGCPETELWTDTASVFTNVSISENGSSVTVSTGIPGSNICVMSVLDNGESYFDYEPDVSSHTFNNVPFQYLVTATRHNYLPYLKNPDTTYVQNESVYDMRTIFGDNIRAGSNVTEQISQGPVIIDDGAYVIFKAENSIKFESGFEIPPGGMMEAKVGD